MTSAVTFNIQRLVFCHTRSGIIKLRFDMRDRGTCRINLLLQFRVLERKFSDFTLERRNSNCCFCCSNLRLVMSEQGIFCTERNIGLVDWGQQCMFFGQSSRCERSARATVMRRPSFAFDTRRLEFSFCNSSTLCFKA